MKFWIWMMLAAVGAQAHAFDFSDWLKKGGGYQRKRSVKSKSTNVAAVRGVDEPGDVDPDARDFPSLKKVESRQSAPASQLSGQSEDEIKIGRDVAANVIAQFGLYEDNELTSYVYAVGLKVANSAPKRDIPYRFAVLNSDILNAFAAPGGYIFVTRGLLAALKDESQLACVLAHEVAHITQRHVMKAIQKSRMVEAVIPAYAKASADKAKYMKPVADMAVKMLWKGLSREDELDSDRLAIDYASAAGYDAASFRDVLLMLKSRAQTPQGVDQHVKFILSTHPKPDDRIRAVEEKLRQK